MTNAATTFADKLINQALDAVEVHVVNRLEQTGIVSFQDEEEDLARDDVLTESKSTMTQKAEAVCKKIERMRSARTEKKLLKTDLLNKKRIEDSLQTKILMDCVKNAKENKENKKIQETLQQQLLNEVKRLRERVKNCDDRNDDDDDDDFDGVLQSAIKEIRAHKSLRSELDVSLRQLELAKNAKLNEDEDITNKEFEKFENRVEREVEKKVKQLELRKTAAETQADLARKKHAEAEQSLKELRARHDVAQSKIFELENNEIEAKQILMKDRESLKLESINLTKREEEFLRRQVEQGLLYGTNQTKIPELGVSELTEKVQVKERMIAKLAEDLEAMEKKSVEVAQEAEKNVITLTKQLNATKAQLRDTSQELKKEQEFAEINGAKIVEELRERVRVLQALVNSEDGDAAEAISESTGSTSTTTTNAEGGRSNSIEQNEKALLAVRDKNRRLAAEIAVAERAKNEANKEKEVAVERAVAAETKLMQAAETIAVLEDDLAKRTQMMIVNADDDGVENNEKNKGEDSTEMVSILAAQRDRFKRRVSELDDEKSRVTLELSSTTAKAVKLEEDNVKLFEKIRYVQQYYASKLSQSSGGGGANVKILRVDEAGVPLSDSLETEKSANKNARYSCGVGGVTIGVDRLAISDGMRKRAQRYGCGFSGSGGDMESQSLGGDEGGIIGRYRDKYLARLNPFAAFKSSEIEEGGTSMQGAHDRIAMAGGKALLSSRRFRAVFAIYFLAMHLFVASVLYTHREMFT